MEQSIQQPFRSPDRSPAHRRWTTSALLGTVPGIVLHCWMLTGGSWNLFRWGRQSDFYDVQARALLDGTFAMDQRVLGIESFARGDQHFMYFGPVPALLRLPVVAFTRHLDGRMAAVSMLLALGVTILALLTLGWRLRARVMIDSESPESRNSTVPPAPAISRFESVAVALTFFAMIGGSSLLYASSRTWVYHEAILWGVALTLTSLALLLVWLDNCSRWFLVGASTVAMLAILTRPSVGGAALAALGLVAARALLASLRGHDNGDISGDGSPRDGISREGSPEAWKKRSMYIAVVVVPVIVYSAVNWLKFRSLLGVPFDQQGYTLLSQQRRDMLEANGGTLFNPAFVPTNLVSYLRPDLVGVDGVFPFVQPRRPVSTIGTPFYDLIDLTAGVPTTMPLLVVLGLVGVWAVVRRPHSPLRAVWPLLAGCVLGTGAVLAIGYLANRYQSDFLPLLAVAALIGLPVVVSWRESQHSERQAAVGLVLAVGLVGVGTVANMALGFSYQRAYGPSTHPDVVASYLRVQDRVDGVVGDGALAQVSHSSTLPENSRLGDIAIIGDCDGLYLSDGGDAPLGARTQWRLAELSAQSGAAAGTVTLDRAQSAATPLVHVQTESTATTVVIEVDEARGVMTVVAISDDVRTRGPDLPLRTGDELSWQAFADPVLGRFEVFIDGRFGVFTEVPTDVATVAAVGVNVEQLDGVFGDATTSVTSAGVETAVCEQLLGDLER